MIHNHNNYNVLWQKQFIRTSFWLLVYSLLQVKDWREAMVFNLSKTVNWQSKARLNKLFLSENVVIIVINKYLNLKI